MTGVLTISGKTKSWTFTDGTDIGVADSSWLESTMNGWRSAIDTPPDRLILDLSNVGWMGLREWATTAALAERVLERGNVSLFEIDLVGQDEVLASVDFEAARAAISKGEETPDVIYRRTARAYRLLGFLEAIGTLDVLNPRNRERVAFYPRLSVKTALRSWRLASDDGVLLGLTRIDGSEDCHQFLDSNRIDGWRKAMAKRFTDSPLFEYEELWRVLCHELAANAWEHSESVGMIAARVIRDGSRAWCKQVFDSVSVPVLDGARGGFVELCVADAGRGIASTLGEAYARFRAAASAGKESRPDIVMFAFDEQGSCKDPSASWATERHALGRILRLVEKYGGLIKLSSSGVAISYRGDGTDLVRRADGAGYQPLTIGATAVVGTQLQILLPLSPRFDSVRANERARLARVLPKNFFVQESQPRGHLVPVAESLAYQGAMRKAIGTTGQKSFREACEGLARQLLTRPREEPLVFDMAGTNWVAAQFETFLFLFQGIIQSRPTLFVEVPRQLAFETSVLEQEAGPSRLLAEAAPTAASVTGRSVGALAERTFNEAYVSMHSTVLCIDDSNTRRILGLRDPRYGEVLLGLSHTPASLREIDETYATARWYDRRLMSAILTPANKLVEMTGRQWRLCWDEDSLAVETVRVITRHPEEVIDRSGARLLAQARRRNEDVTPVFFLPWLGKWRTDFFCASQLLSRSRQVDEIALRLVYRLAARLRSVGKELSDVGVLACVSAPSMMLATALHRSWPADQGAPPAVADLGHYFLFRTNELTPLIRSDRDIVIVQDVYDTGRQLASVVTELRRTRSEIIAVIGVAKMDDKLVADKATEPDDWWIPEEVQPPITLGGHSLIRLRPPGPAQQPASAEGERNAYWIEPRSLRPVRYPTLRREFVSGRDFDLERRDEVLKKLDEPTRSCALAAGHYVYGRRHYAVAVDIKNVLEGPIGDSFSNWVADVCEGRTDRVSPSWERASAKSLLGDVTAVLLPLHSQIHYLWPRIQAKLARRGKRQPMWLLEASLFTGRGPEYSIPSQLQYQLEEVFEARKARGPAAPGLRLLVLDDAAVTGRTAETVLSTLSREAYKAARKVYGAPPPSNPIEWVRYAVVLNQMDYPQFQLWSSMRHFGNDDTRFSFVSYAPFMGMPVFSEEGCPACHDLSHLTQLDRELRGVQLAEAFLWASRRKEELEPVATDSPSFVRSLAAPLKRPINVLAAGPGSPGTNRYAPWFADTAIWRFSELMYLSYPPGDVLKQVRLPGAPEDEIEYGRYRFAVLEWCLKHLARVQADGSVEKLREILSAEIAKGTEHLPALMLLLAPRIGDPFAKNLFGQLVDEVLATEQGTYDVMAKPSEVTKSLSLRSALSVCLAGVKLAANDRDDDWKWIRSTLKQKLQEQALPPLHILRIVERQIERPRRYADPAWALESVAATVFRGRDRVLSPLGHHRLLPNLLDIVINKVASDRDRANAYAALGLFRAALEDLNQHLYLPESADVIELANRAQTWLRDSLATRESSSPDRSLSDLLDALDLHRPFVGACERTFHQDVNSLLVEIENGSKRPEFKAMVHVTTEPGTASGSRVLTDVHDLRELLMNVLVDQARNATESFESRVTARLVASGAEIEFVVGSTFRSENGANEYWRLSRSCQILSEGLKQFGASFDTAWVPNGHGWDEFRFRVKAGFVKGRV